MLKSDDKLSKTVINVSNVFVYGAQNTISTENEGRSQAARQWQNRMATQVLVSNKVEKKVSL